MNVEGERGISVSRPSNKFSRPSLCPLRTPQGGIEMNLCGEKGRKIAGENLQNAEPAFVASIGYPGIERHKLLFLVVRVSFALFASLR
jgi:hypothetical protein